MTADCCMKGDRVEAKRGCPREVVAHARWKPEREAEDKRRRRRRRRGRRGRRRTTLKKSNNPYLAGGE